jgi:hypothetical protein
MLTFESGDPSQAIEWIQAERDAILTKPPSRPKHPDDRTGTPTVIDDVAGFDLCPDPLQATNAAELMQILRQYRIWAGEPSLREMKRACGNAMGVSTISGLLNSSDLPPFRSLVAIVKGCGGDEDHQRAFATAWRRLRLSPGMAADGKPGEE